MLKDYFEVPNKPAIKSGNVLSCDFTDHETFIPQPLDFTRNTLATYVDCNGFIKVGGVSDTELVTNGDFSQSGAVTSTSWTLGWQSADTGVSISDNNLILARTTSTVRTYATNGVNSFIALTNGSTYQLTYTVTSNDDNASLDYHNGGAYVTAPNAVGTHTLYYTTTGTIFLFRNNTNNSTIKIGNVSIKEVDLNFPRIDYLTEIGKAKELQKPSLLLEPQSTNLVTFSENFNSNLYTETNISVTSNSIISPDGTKNASMLTDDSTNGQHRLTTSALFTADGNNRCWSIFVKKGTSRYCAFNHVGGFTSSVNTIVFDFDTATYSSVGTTAYMDEVFPPQNYGNGWYKISFRSDINSSAYNRLNIGLSSGPTYSDASYAGTGDTVYVWGGQVEQQDYVTSYIPTSGSTLTRNGESCNNAGQLGVFNDTEGVLYLEAKALINGGVNREITLTSGASTNIIRLRYSSTTSRFEAFLRGGGGTIQSLSRSALTQDVYRKIALVYDSNEFAMWIDGSKQSFVSTTNLPIGLNEFEFELNGASFFYGKVREVKVFRRALTDAELTELTNNIV